MNEDLRKFAEKYNWKLEVWHGEYKGVLCGVQEMNPGAFCTLWRSQMRFRAVALRSITAARF